MLRNELTNKFSFAEIIINDKKGIAKFTLDFRNF